MHYPGIDNDRFGGMTDIGKIIRDAWVFGVLPETETCAGWDYGRIEALYDRVHEAWLKHQHSVAKLPPELRERHERIYREAIARARAQGWTPQLAFGEDE